MPLQRSSRANPAPRVVARVMIRPPVRPSEGAQAINAMFGARSRLSRLDPVPRQYSTVINWGNTSPLTVGANVRVLNKPSAIAVAVNKLSAFRVMRDGGVRVPDFQTDKPTGSRDIYLARTVLGGSGGAGIVVIRPGDVIPAAPLYTQYVRKTEEWRIHVAFGRAIFAQMKLRERDNDQTADQKLIRNHDNGWVFAPRDLDVAGPDAVNEAVKAVAALGLDFGAVDIIIGKRDDLPYVLEVNTAPGIQSPTLKEAYQQAFTTEVTA